MNGCTDLRRLGVALDGFEERCCSQEIVGLMSWTLLTLTFTWGSAKHMTANSELLPQ